MVTKKHITDKPQKSICTPFEVVAPLVHQPFPKLTAEGAGEDGPAVGKTMDRCVYGEKFYVPQTVLNADHRYYT